MEEEEGLIYENQPLYYAKEISTKVIAA